MIQNYLRLAALAIVAILFTLPSTGFACSMTSNPEVTIALGNPATHTIDEDEILEGTPTCTGFTVTVFNTNGSMRLDPVVDCDDVGDRLLVKVTSDSGNSVWSYVTIIDNLKPVVTAANITVTCVEDIEQLGFAAISASDNCTAPEDLDYRITSTPSSVGCANGIAQTFVRSIFVIDGNGNRSATVPQTITVERIDIADVNFPANITYFTSDTTICPAAFGTPEIEFPTVNGNPISSICKLLTTVEDEALASCGSSRKILRNYRVLDCCTNEVRTGFQVITIMDDQAPQILTGIGQALQDTINAVNIQGNQNCTGTVFFQPITALDSCVSNPLTYRISTPFGMINSNGGHLNASFPLDGTSFNAIYEVSDACGNTARDTVVILRNDNQPPVAICDEITTVSLATAATTIPAINFDDGSYDNCFIDSFTVRRMGDIDWEEFVTFTCDDVGDTVLVEFRVTDFDGNSNICMVSVIVEDKSPASVNPLPTLTFSCIRNPVDTFLSGVPTVNEVCIGGYQLDTIINDDSMLQCRTGVQKRKFIFSNATGEMIMTTQMINYVDSGSFTIPTSLSDTTIDCSLDPLAMPTLQFSTDCDVFAVNTSAATTRVIDCRTTEFNVVYNYMPLCGNGPGFSLTRKITSIDNDGPVFDQSPGELDATYACMVPGVRPEPTATDNCNGAIVTLVDSTTVSTGVPGCPDVATTYTYTTEDLCGNVNPVPYIQVIRLRDTIAPNFGTINDFALACKAAIRDTFPAYTAVANGVTDNCTGMVNVQIRSSVYDTADACIGSILRTYIATDLCGNTSTGTQAITYDQTNQGLILNALDPITGLQCYDDVINFPEPSLQALGGSACGAGLTITGTTTDPNPMVCPATIMRTYIVEDNCGNTGMINQSFTYNDDVDPVILGVVDLNFQCRSDVPNSALTMGALSISENCSVDTLVASDFIVGLVNDCSGTIVRTYTATDDCGNTGKAEQTITWNGIGALSLTTPAPNTTEFTCYQDILDVPTISNPIAFGTGFCGTDLQIDSVNHSNDPGCSGQVLRGYFLQDGCGNRDSVFQIFMLNDTIAPVFTSINDIMVVCAADVPDPSVTVVDVMASDNCIGRAATVQFFSDNVISSGTCTGSLVRTYFATDGCGNVTTATQTISYDQTGQSLSFDPISPVNDLECYDQVVNAPNPTINLAGGNVCGNNLMITNVDVQNPPGTCPATVLKTFTVEDDCGNSGIVTQSFTYNDITDPVISGVVDITVQCQSDVPSDSLTLLDIMVADNCSVDTVVVSNIENPTNTSCSGSIIRSYTATDDCGNTAVVDQSISWNGVGTLTLTTPAPNTTVFACYQDILDAPQITDPITFGTGFCGTDLQIDSINHSDDPGCIGQVLRGYFLQDGCGNRDSVFQIFMMNDTTGPTFSGVMDTMIQCASDLPSEQMTSANISAFDSCAMTTTSFSVSTIADSQNNTCAGFFTRTYTAIDQCNNPTVATQIISYGGDTLALNNLPEFPDTFLCYQDVLDFQPTYSANQFGSGACGLPLSFVGTYTNSPDPGCFGNVTRTFTLQDSCGNMGTATQILVVKDTVGPELEAPRDRTIFNRCEMTFLNLSANLINTQNNLCNNNPSSFTYTNNSPYIGGAGNSNSLNAAGTYLSGLTIITYTATDLCGNTDSVTSFVNIVDTESPAIACNTVFLELDSTGTATISEDSLRTYFNPTDNCEIVSIDLVSPLDLTWDCTNNLPLVQPYLFEVVDRAGNRNTGGCDIVIQDPPKIDCRDLEFSLRPSETSITITEAQVLSQFTFSDNCTPIDSLEFDSSFPVTYSCGQLGNSPDSFMHSITIFDTDNEETTCTFNVIISHDCSSPPADPFSLAGRVDAPLYGGAMNGTIVDLEYSGGSVQTLSDADGYYSFTNVPPGAISLSAKLPMHPASRVTTYDMLRIGQHILGTDDLESPLLILAADVNQSGSVSAFDLTAIRRVILGQDPAFAGQYEATTFGAYHPFSDQNAPWADANDWGTSFPYVSTDMMSQDISLVKLGDINPTDFLRPRSASELVLEDAYVTAGETVDVLVRNDYQMVVAGLQLAMRADGALEINRADSNIEVFTNKVNGAIRISIIQEMLQGEPIMTWTFTPNSSGMLSELIQISNDIPNESYAAEDLQPAQLALNWQSIRAEDSVAEINAFPNPFDDHLSISAHLTEAGKHVLRVSDMSGRSFAERRMDVTQDSWHNLRLDAANWSPGVYILSIEGPSGRLTQRVVLQR